MKIKDVYISVKQKNIDDTFDEKELYSLIERVTSKKYSSKIKFEKIPSDGFDAYKVSDIEDYILIEATSGSAAAYAFNQYLKLKCNYNIGILSISGSLPENPPKVGEVLTEKSSFLYRYFYNFCTYCYTYAFDKWEQWENTLDYVILNGYNLVLNPIGIETIWHNALLKIGYSKKDVKNFLCGPAFYAWQWMMNQSGWLNGTPDWYYEERAELAGKINLRLQSFGIGVVGSGYIGMIPADFNKYFPDSKIVNQGEWFGYVRPCFILPNDPNYDKMADAYYSEFKKIKGADKIKYFSNDPFHEGGKTAGVDLATFGKLNYQRMAKECDNAVWLMQGWSTPQPDIINNIPEGNVLVVNLVADTTVPSKDLYAGAPWCYCAVNCFGGQYNFQGDAESILINPFIRLKDDVSNLVGIGYMPEGVNCNEIIYQILSENAFKKGYKDLEEFLKFYIKTTYLDDSDYLIPFLKDLCRYVLNGKQLISGESALCARPSLTVVNVGTWSAKPNPFVDQTVLVDYIKAMLSKYDELEKSNAFKRDLLEATRQAISNLSWFFVEMIKQSYAKKDVDGVSYYGKELLSLFDLQVNVVKTDKDMLLGTWLEKAKAVGKTPAEKTFFEFNARTLITLWGKESAFYFHDYSAREWQGLLEDFYMPRWETFISRLEISLLTENELENTLPYHEELPFVYQKKSYPTEASGDLKQAVIDAVNKIESVKVQTVQSKEQASFLDNVLETID